MEVGMRNFKEKCGVFHNTGNDDGGCDHFAVLLFLNPILHAMNVPEEQFCMAHDYIRILVWGMFVTLAYNLCADMLRAIGDSVTPLIFLVIAAVTNIVLDYLFIGGFSMGVSGAACATVLSQLVSSSIMLSAYQVRFPNPSHLEE